MSRHYFCLFMSADFSPFQRQLCFPSHYFKHPLSYLCLCRLLHFHHRDGDWTDILFISGLEIAVCAGDL